MRNGMRNQTISKILNLLSSGYKMTSEDTWGSGDSLNINIAELKSSANSGNTIILKNDFNDSFEFSGIN